MTSQPIRDPLADHLITRANSALAVIDYQPSQIQAVRSIDHDLLLSNVVSTVKVAKLFGLPIIHSTINVANGQGPTLPGLAEELADSPPIDRTQINSWEDAEFLAAVRATGRQKLILCALWTEVCMAFPALDAMREGTRSIPSSTRSAAPQARLTSPVSNGPFNRAHSRSVGYRSPASCSASGRASRPSPRSSRSSSTSGWQRADTPASRNHLHPVTTAHLGRGDGAAR
jgi:hypothetical protein